LTVDQIEAQSPAELEASLERVNDAIAHPDSFGTLSMKATASGGRLLMIVAGPVESTVTVGILPILLERKSLILTRLAELRGSQGIDSLRQLIVRSVPDPSVRERLESDLAQLEEARETERQAAQAAAQSDIEAVRQTMLLKVEALERRSQVVRSFLERESIAAIVGAFLLIVFAVSIVAAMFANVAVGEIVSSAFLLILGYFFGQSVGQGRGRDIPG
jgi:ABC-type transport system involved in cytochrome c biogenesis permease subunit